MQVVMSQLQDEIILFAPDDAHEAPRQSAGGAWDILVVDDDEAVHAVTRMVLQHLVFDGRSIRLDHAGSAAGAEEKLRRNTYALVLLDVVMETDNAGLELVRCIRDLPALAETRIVLCTGHPGQAPEERIMMDYDIDDYRDKSGLTSQRLKTAVFSALRSHQRLCENRDQRLELARSRNRLQALMGALPSAIVGISAGGHIILWNPAAERLSGLPEGEVTGRDFAQPLEQLSVDAALLHRVMQDGETYTRLRERVTLPQGTTIVRDLHIHPVPQAGGAVVRLDDVSVRDRMENLMVQSEKMLSLGSMAAGMAHELNNPLGAVLQGVDTVRRRLDGALPANVRAAHETGLTLAALGRYMEQRRILYFLDGIEHAGRRAAVIVRDMLDFSRQSGEKQPADVHRLIAAALELAEKSYDLHDAWDFRNVQVERCFASSLPQIPCAAQEIEQVLLNLFHNAAQAMTPEVMQNRTPRLCIRTAALETGVCIEVEDNGPGIPEDISKRVFDPFFTTKPPGKGTGLGLSVSFHIVVDRHGGEFHMISPESGGACFRILLPYTAGRGAGAQQQAC